MKIVAIASIDYVPIREFCVEDLGNPVIVAGANGSGKTRLKEALVGTFREPAKPQIEIHLQSTRDEEEKNWNSEMLIVQNGKPNQSFQNYMASRTRGGTYTGTAIQVDSDRSVAPVKFQSIPWSVPDPDQEETPYTYYLELFANRWQKLVNKIFFKVANRRDKIAQFILENPKTDAPTALSKNPDPFIPYQEIFRKLLLSKTLDSIDPKQPKEFQYHIGDAGPFSFTTLSSGEQEVIKIAFDLIWKKIKHCVIFIDEPELHLHPSLTFRLIETIKSIGDYTNQLFLFTHSADLISTYYSTGNVLLIDTVSKKGNQAHRLSQIDSKHSQTTRVLANNLGIFAVGKKIVFVEGNNASIDRLTYHRVAQRISSEMNFIPTGSVQNLMALRSMIEELSQSVFGLGLFMIRDRDGLEDKIVKDLESSVRFRCLFRRQLENYFLDEEILALVAKEFRLDEQWRVAPNILQELKKIAESFRGVAGVFHVKEYARLNGYIMAPSVRDIERKSSIDLQSELQGHFTEQLQRVSQDFASDQIENLFNKTMTKLEADLKNGKWKLTYPGKLIFRRFCGKLKCQEERVREAYIDIALEKRPGPLEDIIKIFEQFNGVS